MASGEDRAPTTVSNNTDQAPEEGSSQEQQASQEQTDTHAVTGQTEYDENPQQGPHKHQFRVKLCQDPEEYTVSCNQPRTVLAAIKTLGKKIDCHDDFIIILRGIGENDSIIATHFPCSCIEDGELLTILCQTESVEKIQSDRNRKFYRKDKYSIFYINTEEEENRETKTVFKNKAVAKEPLRYLCVYGEKGITVATALNRDGRFIADLGSFELLENENRITSLEKVDNLDNRKFHISFPQEPRTTRPRSVDTNMYLALNLRKENFAKIQESFSEVPRVRKLLELGKSVCKIIVNDVFMGTGFVLFGKENQNQNTSLNPGGNDLNLPYLILTRAHLFDGYVEGNELRDVKVRAEFDYENPDSKTKSYYFIAENTLFDFDVDLDYAVLNLQKQAYKPENQRGTNRMSIPGLFSVVGKLPANGEACIIGHPAGGVKKMDPTFIIEIAQRGQAADEKLRGLFIIKSISDYMRKKGTEIILEHKKAGNKYHGASGSPVFDDDGRVFGLHTGEFTYGYTKEVESVIEYGFSLTMILKKFVNNLKESRNEELLKKVTEMAVENELLKEVL